VPIERDALNLVRQQRIAVLRLYDRGIAREVFVLQPQDVRMGRDVTESFEHGEREVQRGRSSRR